MYQIQIDVADIVTEAIFHCEEMENRDRDVNIVTEPRISRTA